MKDVQLRVVEKDAVSAREPLLLVGTTGQCGVEESHFVEHRAELEAALPRTAAAMVARFDEVWRAFRGAIRERGRAGLGETTPAGWTYRDLCAHAANWMQLAVRDLAAGTVVKWDASSIQAENDRAVEAHHALNTHNVGRLALQPVGEAWSRR